MNNLRRLAPLGLVIAALAIISLCGFFIAFALASNNLYMPENPGVLSQGIWISAGMILLGLALSALLDPERARSFLFGRQAQRGSIAIITILAVGGALIAVNILAYQNNQTWDWSANANNSLAPETIELLQTLAKPVEARAYYSAQTPSDDARTMLERFKQNSNGKFNFQFFDYQQENLAAEQDGAARDGAIILQMGDQRQSVSYASERELASAIIRLANPQNSVLYFLTGHGEIAIEPAEISLSAVRRALEGKNYTVKSLNLASTGSIPPDAQAVIIARAARPLLENEISAIESYLARGGGIIVMVEPDQDESAPENDPLTQFLTRWAVGFRNDIIVDPIATQPLYAIANPQTYGAHPITNGLDGIFTIFPTARSINILENETLRITPLASTDPNAWGETDFASLQAKSVSFDESSDHPGPLTLAVAVQDFSNNGRLVAFGDSDFATDTLYQRGNGDILVNAIDWAANQENLINLTAKEPIERTYNPPGALGLVGILLVSLCGLPLLVIAGGLLAWISRRKRG